AREPALPGGAWVRRTPTRQLGRRPRGAAGRGRERRRAHEGAAATVRRAEELGIDQRPGVAPVVVAGARVDVDNVQDVVVAAVAGRPRLPGAAVAIGDVGLDGGPGRVAVFHVAQLLGG